MAEEDGPAAALELLGLGSLLGLALVRVPAADHRSLGGACRTLRRIVLGDDFARLRETVGADEHGLLLMDGELGDQRLCLTHDLPKLGLAPPELVPPPWGWCEVGSRSFVMERNSGQLKIHDSTTGSWSLGPPLTKLKSKQRNVLTMVEVGHGVIFVFACKTPPLSLVPRPRPPQWPPPRDESSVYVYIDEKKVWLEIFPLPVLANQLVACVHDGRLVVAGEPHRYSAHEGPFVYELDLPSGAWTSKCVLDRQWPEVGGLSALVSFPLRLRAR